MFSIIKTSLVVICVSSLVGCASIVNGTNQSVSVQTGPVTGANCELANDKGKWYVNGTPGSVTVHRSYQDLTVNCQKKGFASGNTKVESKTKGMAFGNAVFGGVVGAGADMADGAAYDYPQTISVPMSKTTV
jgi:hypothetical protein